MPISTIQFNGSNAYSFAPGEFITSREFGIVNMDDIAFGAEVFASNASAKLRATMRFINSAGKLLSASAQTYTPTVLNLWERAVFTWPVPVNAVRCELRLEGVTSTILMAQPKAANGIDPGSYGSNWSPQLTFLTPSGIYTGTLTAKQIILSAGEDLSDRLVTLNENQISLQNRISSNETKVTNIEAGQVTLVTKIEDAEDEITVIKSGMVQLGTAYNGVEISRSKGLEISSTIGGKAVSVKLNTTEGLGFYENGAFRGGLRNIDGQIGLVAGVLSRDGGTTRYVEAGALSGGGGGFSYYNKTVQNAFLFALTELVGGGFALVDRHDRQRISINPNGAFAIRDQSGHERFGLPSSGGAVVRDSSSNTLLDLSTSYAYIYGSGGVAKFFSDSTQTVIQRAANSGALGVDSGGPFYITNGRVKKYLT